MQNLGGRQSVLWGIGKWSIDRVRQGEVQETIHGTLISSRATRELKGLCHEEIAVLDQSDCAEVITQHPNTKCSCRVMKV